MYYALKRKNVVDVTILWITLQFQMRWRGHGDEVAASILNLGLSPTGLRCGSEGGLLAQVADSCSPEAAGGDISMIAAPCASMSHNLLQPPAPYYNTARSPKNS